MTISKQKIDTAVFNDEGIVVGHINPNLNMANTDNFTLVHSGAFNESLLLLLSITYGTITLEQAQKMANNALKLLCAKQNSTQQS
jgi:hypothetical protein